MREKLFYHGDILTMEAKLREEAVLIRDGKIVFVGGLSEAENMAGEDVEKVDLEGKTLLPSFIDAHSHFLGYANALLQVDLSEACSLEEIKKKIQNFIIEHKIEKGEWVLANGMDPDNLEEKMLPDITFLDEAAPDNPVVCQHQSGHSGVFNTKALEKLGIDCDTLEPEGGRIGRCENRLTGLLEENAFVEYIRKVEMPSRGDLYKACEKAQERYLSYGITTVQEGFIVPELAQLIRYLQLSKLLKLDLIGYVDIKSRKEILKDFKDCVKKYDHHFKVGGYKIFLDGSPQSLTAWMLTPYLSSKSGFSGIPLYTDQEVEAFLETAVNDNMQILVHSNGDAACDQYIAAYKNVLEKTKKKYDIRPVIVHAQFLKPSQLGDVKGLKMIPSFFVGHVYYWGDVHIKNMGKERAAQISPAHSAQNMNLPFTFHQDSPVTEPNMLETIWIAVNRITKSGVELGKEEAIEPLEALKAVTINAAHQYFEEETKGSIRIGKRADFVILDKNPLEIDKILIKDIQVVETIKDGETVYRSVSSRKGL